MQGNTLRMGACFGNVLFLGHYLTHNILVHYFTRVLCLSNTTLNSPPQSPSPKCNNLEPVFCSKIIIIIIIFKF
jgi:hypothetical protein